MIVLLFLISELIIEVTANLFQIPISSNIRELFSFVLPILPLVITLLPLNRDNVSMQSVDILHTLATSALLCVLIFGSLLNICLGQSDYLAFLVISFINYRFFPICIQLVAFTQSWV